MNVPKPIHKLKNWSKRAFPAAYSRYILWQYQRVPLVQRIAPILSSSESPRYHDGAFDRLQASFKNSWGEYGYDRYSTWVRGCERALSVLRLAELRAVGLDVFEAGCGEGMTGYALACYGHNVTLSDIGDWRDTRARSLAFVQGDICSRLPVSSDSFDLLISYNAFEHVEDPQAALIELVRLCKQGGLLHIEFSPLYCSPVGLHAFSFSMPYPQFLFSPSFIEAKVRELGVNDLGQTLFELQPTNKWRLAQFRELWRTSGCELVRLTEGVDNRHLQIVMDFPSAFRGRGLTVEDLTISGIAVTLRKR